MLDSQAQICLAQGDAADANRRGRAALDLALRVDNRKAVVDALLTIARARAALGDSAGSLDANRQAGEFARETGTPDLVRKSLRAWADALAERGEHERAYALMREAMAAS